MAPSLFEEQYCTDGAAIGATAAMLASVLTTSTRPPAIKIP